MRGLQGIQEVNVQETDPEPLAQKGLAGWIVGLVQGQWPGFKSQQKQMRIVETLSLGGKRQLMLIECAGESFLVGGGLDNVHTIVRVQGQRPAGSTNDGVRESC